MDLFSYIIFFLVILLFLAFLPLISGIGSYKYVRPQSSQQSREDDESEQSTEYQDYVPLEEQIRKEQAKNKKDSSLSKLKTITITKENVPLKFTTASNILSQNNQSLRNRKARNLDSLNNDPNSYDYDLDDLINEVEEEEGEEFVNEFNTVKAKSQSELEDLA